MRNDEREQTLNQLLTEMDRGLNLPFPFFNHWLKCQNAFFIQDILIQFKT